MRKLAGISVIKLLVAIVLIVAATPAARAVGYYFKQLSVNDGLSQSSVQCICRDSKGFLWIGTKYGLNRYDNESISTFYANSSDSESSITSNDIKFILEDKEGTIWVAATHGTSIFDTRTGTFTEMKCESSRINVRSFCTTTDGIILGGAGIIYFYSYADKEVRRINVKGGSSMFYTYVGRLADGRFVLATRWDGVWIYNPATTTITRFAELPENKIMATCIDIHGNLYISPYGAGIYCYSPDLKLTYHAGTHNHMLSSNLVTDMEECDGKLWIGTDGGGINLLDIESRQSQPLNTSSSFTTSLPVSSVLCLYKDADDNMWAGTVRGGVMYIHSVYMHTYSNLLKNDNRWISARTVLCTASASNGNILIGIDDGGVCEYNPAGNYFKEYPSTFGMKVSSLAEIDADNVIISEYASGIFILNKTSGRLSRLTYVDSHKDNLLRKNPVAVNIVPLADKNILFVSDSLYLYSLQKRQFSVLPQPGGASKGNLNCFYSDSVRAMMFRGREVYEFDSRQQTCRLVASLKGYPDISCAQYDGKSIIYFGSTDGILSFDTATGEYKQLESDMLRCVTAMVLDGNNLWIGAQNSLFLRIIDSGNTLILGQADGVETNEFIYKAVLKAPSGIYMGGINGLLRIDKNAAHEILNSNAEIGISLTDVLIDGISQSKNLNGLKIDVPYDHSSVTIRLIDREKNTFRRKMFKYTIEGTNRDNNIIESNKRSLTLNMLQSGNYKVFVSCSTQDGRWTSPVMLVELNVLSPWWRSGYAFFAYFTIIVLIWVMVTRYLYNKKKDQMELRMKEHERMNYEKQVNFLVNINHELRTPLTLIYAPLKSIIKRLHNVDTDTIETELKGIYRQTKKMRNIINMILDLKKLQSGHTELRFTDTDINNWVKSISDDFTPEFESKQLSIDLNLDESLGIIRFDIDKSGIILSNIIMNALKYTAAGSGITISTARREEFVRISVSDCGPGLNGVDPNRLFTMFYQGDNAVFGTGLGLAYSKALVTLQKGNIGANDNENTPGATFWFELPLKPADGDVLKVSLENNIFDSDTVTTDTAPKSADDLDMTAYKAIVIEDDTDLNSYIVNNLSPFFGKVFAAFNGKDAMIMIKQNKPDIIISDVMVPQLNGFELCRNVKSSDELRHIPIILLTARINEDSIEQGYNLGADSYMSKPFSLDMLLARCRNLLQNRRIMRQRYNSRGPASKSLSHSLNNSNESFLIQINKLIIENIENPNFNVDIIVDKMLMSRASVYNRLKELTGYSIGDYVNEIRFTQAKEMLSGSDIPISEIASRLGFSSQRYFSTFFKNKTGLTPSAFRAANRHSKQPAAEEGVNE